MRRKAKPPQKVDRGVRSLVATALRRDATRPVVSARLMFAGAGVRCALGRTGLTSRKQEGDGGTPVGQFRILEVLYRSDRLPRPRTQLPCKAIKPTDIWCDDPRSRFYNRFARVPLNASHERLWRNDSLYDTVVVLDYNLRPAIAGRGSAIFFHLAGADYGSTAGCLAISAGDMRRLLARLSGGATMLIR